MDISEFIDRSYVPYSGSPNVAIAESSDGTLFAGCLIENISYPLTINAEQNALYNCLSEGHTPQMLYTTAPDQHILSFWKNEFDVSVEPLEKSDFSEATLEDSQLDKDIDIKKKLELLLDLAVVEESNFPVAALVETKDGFYPGVNIECSAWNMGLCAERVALAKALTYSDSKILSLHIHTRYGEFSSPCGACRQVILEHMPDQKVHLHHANDTRSIHFSHDLMPHSFRSSSLLNS